MPPSSALEIRALASMGVLTTGFNAPAVDLIAMLRPTKSAGLYVQMAGRGTQAGAGQGRTASSSTSPAMSAAMGRSTSCGRGNRGESGDGAAPTKVCPECESILPIAASECPDCGYEFPQPPVKIAPTASTLAILSGQRDRWVEVTSVTYRRHIKDGSPPSLRVEYHCGLAIHKEWVCFEHQGYARLKAEGWWQRRAPSFVPIPQTVEEALNAVGSLPRPSHIFIRSKGRFTEVTQYRFEACTPSNRPLRGLSPRAPPPWLVRCGLRRIRPTPRCQPEAALQPQLPGHLPREERHDRSDTEREGGHGPWRPDGR